MRRIFIALFLFLPSPVWSSFPRFIAPDQHYLLRHDILTQENCKPGEVRLRPLVRLNIRENFCKSYCSSEWEWRAGGNEQCHSVERLNKPMISIAHYWDNEGHTDYSEAIADYGEGVHLKFSTRPGDYWYCVLENEETSLITCANDI